MQQGDSVTPASQARLEDRLGGAAVDASLADRPATHRNIQAFVAARRAIDRVSRIESGVVGRVGLFRGSCVRGECSPWTSCAGEPETIDSVDLLGLTHDLFRVGEARRRER